MVCESIACRVPGLSDKTKKQVTNFGLSDNTLFVFLEEYLLQLEGPLALQVWNRFLQLAKDVLVSGVKDFKSQVFPVLKCITVLAEKLTQTTATEDRKIRKDLQVCVLPNFLAGGYSPPGKGYIYEIAGCNLSDRQP